MDVVEDSAHGPVGKYKCKYLGTIGCLASQSFHETKDSASDEGGALIINNWQHIECAEIIRETGTDRSRLCRGEVDKHTWLDPGSSHIPLDLVAAFSYGHLEAREEIQVRWGRMWGYFDEHLEHWGEGQGVRLPIVAAHCEQSYYLSCPPLPLLEEDQALIGHTTLTISSQPSISATPGFGDGTTVWGLSKAIAR